MISLRPSTTRSITTELVPDVIGTDERHALVHEVRKLRVVVDRPRPFHALRRLTMLRNWTKVPGFARFWKRPEPQSRASPPRMAYRTRLAVSWMWTLRMTPVRCFSAA